VIQRVGPNSVALDGGELGSWFVGGLVDAPPPFHVDGPSSVRHCVNAERIFGDSNAANCRLRCRRSCPAMDGNATPTPFRTGGNSGTSIQEMGALEEWRIHLLAQVEMISGAESVRDASIPTL